MHSCFNCNRLSALLCVAVSVVLTGCGNKPGTSGPVSGSSMNGFVHGGQQPIIGAQVSMYAAGTTGYGKGAISLLTGGNVMSDSGGNFSITGQYTCPSASAQVYLVATGGNT